MATISNTFYPLATVARAMEAVLRYVVPRHVEPEKHLARICNVPTFETKQERFDQAIRYAQAQMLDPKAKQFYSIMARRLKCTHAYNAAVRDYMKDPDVSRIVLSHYTGEKRDCIFIESDDYFKINIVIVEISSSEGVLLESGTATRRPGEKKWRYLTTESNPSLAGTKVKVFAIDRPGREVMMEVSVG
jgi:hypothetical protein